MVNVETVDLAARDVIFPSDRVGMVISQPYLQLTAAEPYRCKQKAKAKQLTVLTDTLAVARTRPHAGPKTHFTIFPEYSIPGPEGVALIDTAIGAAEWPSGTIVIGGTDGLSKQDFTTLASAANTHLDTTHNDLNRVANDEWINCCVTWVKAANGNVERWLQPKLSPAWPEQNILYQRMFQGRSMFVFKGPLSNGLQYRFSTTVCFDWISTIDGKKPWQWLVDGLQQQAVQAHAEQISLSWMFVIQRNEKPSHSSFLAEVSGFFDATISPVVRRERTCLVFANNAGKAVPGGCDEYGSTSLVFTRQTLFSDPTCHPTFCNGGMRFRSSGQLSAYRDVLFRERGACIHSLAQVNPDSLNAGAAGRTIALQNAFVFPLTQIADPRTPSLAVPACVKWLNDKLDVLPALSSYHPHVPLAAQASVIHQQTVAAIRASPAQSAEHMVELAASESKAGSPDEWDQTEVEAVEHVTHTLNIMGLGFPVPSVGADSAHATVTIQGQRVDLLAIRGRFHDTCIRHAESLVPPQRRTTLLISRDADNTPCRRKLGSFLRQEATQLGQEHNFTDPQADSLYIGYQKLLEIFMNSPDQPTMQGALCAEFTS